ncbi:chorismate-binding protein [Streptomyces sp. NPDC047017]|uniref:chorismate-binding protein n=1 Tax=Streptomyces sp. NPDC047017 TaxID=3155024 RepID=UPI0033C19759
MHRPEATGPGTLEVFTGRVTRPGTLAALPLPPPDPRAGAHQQVLALIPYRQITERGYAAPADDAELVALTVTGQGTLSVDEALRRIPDLPLRVTEGAFDIDDAAYADTVRRVVEEEIGRGEGANFVVKRSFVADIPGYGTASALTLFRRLLRRETGAYWTFVVHTGDRTLVGASPERHVSLHGGRAVMNPISGTYRYPPSGPRLPDLLDFLADRKEADELYMVVDEELKMMARICDGGGRVTGPFLKEMADLAHTEYFVEGRTRRDPRDILRETLFAPTVTGSPLESAARVIARHEPEGRGYYSGVVALIGQDDGGHRTMDTAIAIRTADIDRGGRVRIGVGATVVRHSDPLSEAAETRAKAAGLLAALRDPAPVSLAGRPEVRAALAGRNRSVARFWLDTPEDRADPDPVLAGLRVLVVDAEDTFTAMLNHQLRALDLAVTVRRYDEPYTTDGFDLVVMGPGPGDPRDAGHPKNRHLRDTIGRLLAEGRPFLAVCLSHQLLSSLLGLRLARRSVPNQGVRARIDLFGSAEDVGFYNTFAAYSPRDRVPSPGTGTVEVCRAAGGEEVLALRGPHFASVQFHPESLLTGDGPRILADLLRGVLDPARTEEPSLG